MIKKVNKQQKEELASIWDSYECGKQFKSRIGLYARVAENERFFRGDQWRGIDSEGLPMPVFNIVRRIATYLVSSVMSYSIRIGFDDCALLLRDDSKAKRRAYENLDTLSKLVNDRWERQGMEKIFRDALTDAILTGDGIFYCWFDGSMVSDAGYRGDIRTSLIDSVDLFAADMNNPDIQSQDYVMLSGRCPVSKLRAEAEKRGMPESETALIVPDEKDADSSSYDNDLCENTDSSAQKATYIIRFFRDENGFVCFEKCTRNLILQKERTGLRYYPVVCFNWGQTKHCLHGSSPVSEMIGNQKYINKAFAMEMKHMIDTAFSKVIYDKRLIPEWNNEVGQAIGVMSGGDVSGAVTTVGVGQMQDGYIDIIDRVITYTKELEGATEAALGEVDPTNTSAILALRECADLPLDTVRANLYHAIEELAVIWVDMAKEYMPKGMKCMFSDRTSAELDLTSVSIDDISAKVQIGSSRRYSSSLMMSTLNLLLEQGHISFEQYIEMLPDGVIEGKELLLRKVRTDKKEKEATDGDGN